MSFTSSCDFEPCRPVDLMNLLGVDYSPFVSNLLGSLDQISKDQWCSSHGRDTPNTQKRERENLSQEL